MSSPFSQSLAPGEEARIRAACGRRDAGAVRVMLESNPALREWINEPVFSFNSPAIVAFANDAAMLDVLLAFGADPNRRSAWWAGGFHALHSATGEAADMLVAAGAIPDACAAAHLDRPDLLARLIGDDLSRVHERGGDGQTPLHFAQSRTVIDLLLAAGADIDARDVDHRATAAEWMLDHSRGAGRYELARYLVERGAAEDIFLAAALGHSDRVRELTRSGSGLLDLRTGQGAYGEQAPSSFHIYFWTIGDGRSPLDVAAQFWHQDTLRVLMEFASPVQRLLFHCRRGEERDARAVLHDHPGIISSMSPSEHRAISDAAWSGDVEAVRIMLELGFDPLTPGHDSGTALHCAAWNGSPATVAALLRHRAASSLVAIRDAHHAATPLGWCCHGSRFGKTGHDHAGVARLLLEAGARPGNDSRDASRSVASVLAEWREAPDT
ncbi:hypothetical protein BH11GEM1_BH11GEM1_33000 [soil metagenome]